MIIRIMIHSLDVAEYAIQQIFHNFIGKLHVILFFIDESL